MGLFIFIACFAALWINIMSHVPGNADSPFAEHGHVLPIVEYGQDPSIAELAVPPYAGSPIAEHGHVPPIAEHGQDPFSAEFAGPSSAEYGDVPSVAGNGHDSSIAEFGEFPSIAEFIFNNEQGTNLICGGIIISKLWILTAAHCVDQQIPLYVTVGQYDRAVTTAEESKHRIAFAVIHGLYRPDTKECDIAMLKLRSSIVFSPTVQPAGFPTVEKDYAGCFGTVISWTEYSEHNPTTSLLRKLNIEIQSSSQCHLRLAQSTVQMEKFPYEICVGKTDVFQGPCRGDSGGPLIIKDNNKDIVIGVTSRGSLQCEAHLPEIYVSVYHFIDWINAVMNKYVGIWSIQGGNVKTVKEHFAK